MFQRRSIYKGTFKTKYPKRKNRKIKKAKLCDMYRLWKSSQHFQNFVRKFNIYYSERLYLIKQFNKSIAQFETQFQQLPLIVGNVFEFFCAFLRMINRFFYIHHRKLIKNHLHILYSKGQFEMSRFLLWTKYIQNSSCRTFNLDL